MCDQMAISAHILKIVENNPFFRLKMTTTCNEMFNHHQFLSPNRLCLKIASEHTIFIFLEEILPQPPNAPEPHYFLLFLPENIAPDHITFG